MSARDQVPEPKLSPPVVPPRNDPKPLEPYARSRSLELEGRNPGFKYEWFRRDQLAEKLSTHEIGNQASGFLLVDAWEVVDDKQGVTTGRTRDDAGGAVDSVMTNGELILCRTTVENHAKYQFMERKYDALIDKRLAHGQAHNFGYGASFKTRTAGGRDGIDGQPTEILQGVA